MYIIGPLCNLKVFTDEYILRDYLQNVFDDQLKKSPMWYSKTLEEEMQTSCPAGTIRVAEVNNSSSEGSKIRRMSPKKLWSILKDLPPKEKEEQ